MDPSRILEKAKKSSFYLMVLNFAVARMVPFNKPHGVKVLEVTDTGLKTYLPYKKKNFNHVRGLHACVLATVSEFTVGFLLLSKLGSKYRIIMQRLEMDYHYQGKMDAVADFSVSEEWLQQHVYEPLRTKDSVVVICEVKIHDVKNNHLSTGHVHWQVKEWSKVRTKV